MAHDFVPLLPSPSRCLALVLTVSDNGLVSAHYKIITRAGLGKPRRPIRSHQSSRP